MFLTGPRLSDIDYQSLLVANFDLDMIPENLRPRLQINQVRRDEAQHFMSLVSCTNTITDADVASKVSADLLAWCNKSIGVVEETKLNIDGMTKILVSQVDGTSLLDKDIYDTDIKYYLITFAETHFLKFMGSEVVLTTKDGEVLDKYNWIATGSNTEIIKEKQWQLFNEWVRLNR